MNDQKAFRVGDAARYLAYPLLLIANGIWAYDSLASGRDATVASFLAIVGTIAFVLLLERYIPFRADWRPSRSELRRDGCYFVLLMLYGGSTQAVLAGVAAHLAHPRGALPLWLEIPAILLVTSLGYYCFHRLMHRNRWLWKVHGIHHVPDKVYFANHSVTHLVDVFGSSVATQIPIALLGFSRESVFLTSVFTVAHGYVIHSNADIRLGGLGYLISGPEQHRFHHSVVPGESGHYSTLLPLWDLLFGTFTWRPGRSPSRVGVVDGSDFPSPDSIWQNVLHPFRKLRIVAVAPAPSTVGQLPARTFDKSPAADP
jgi:sterol desaturase/sphingolipid hydroxylase (fatty acid hydroxylase superfamily)